MKELFGVDKTANKRNEFEDGLSYEAKKISGELQAKMGLHNENAKELENKTEFSPALSILRWICALGGFALIVAIVRNIGNLSIGQMFNNAPWLFIICGALAVGWVLLTVYAHLRKRGAESSGEFAAAEADAESLIAEAKRELGIPENAEKIDGLMYEYKSKDGDNKIPEQLYGHFIRGSVYVFTENGCLCICDSAVRYNVPLHDIEGVDIIKKKFYMTGWDKAVMFNEEPYKEFTYKEADNLGRIWLRSICVMRFRLQGDEFNFRFPTYELAVIERLTGIKAAEA